MHESKGMDHRVEIGRYLESVTKDWKIPYPSRQFRGWVATPDWILFEGLDGSLHVYNGRDCDTGAVIGKGIIVQPQQ